MNLSELSVGKLVESAVTSPFIHPVEGLPVSFHHRNGQSYEHDEWARHHMKILFLKERDVTPPKTNIAPKNGGFQQESPFPGVYFQGLC